MSDFVTEMVSAGLMMPSPALGVVAWSGQFQSVVDGLDRLLDRERAAHAMEVIRFPPVMPRKHFEASGYMRGFPQLAGTIHCFCGTEADHRQLLRCMSENEDWTAGQRANDVVLTPAACYPVYPLVAARGQLPEGGLTIDLASWCYREEPSEHPARIRSFRLREFVRIGAAEDIQEFRRHWMARAQVIAANLGLQAEVDVANDPFFGRPGKLRAGMQREEQAKFELLIPIDGQAPSACASFNDAKDLFGALFGLKQANGVTARTGCVGFGIERITLALFRQHGVVLADWPAPVREALGV